MRVKTRKATFSLHSDVLEKLDEAMTHGDERSKNELVERALIKELKELQRRKRQKEWQKAVTDPLFVRDMEDITSAFETADDEASRRLL